MSFEARSGAIHFESPIAQIVLWHTTYTAWLAHSNLQADMEMLGAVLQNLWERLWNFYHYWSYTVYDWRVRRGIVLSL